MKRSDIHGFTIGPIEVVFCGWRLAVIAFTLRGRTYRPLDK